VGEGGDTSHWAPCLIMFACCVFTLACSITGISMSPLEDKYVGACWEEEPALPLCQAKLGRCCVLLKDITSRSVSSLLLPDLSPRLPMEPWPCGIFAWSVQWCVLFLLLVLGV
jgi:hypothetical protein